MSRSDNAAQAVRVVGRAVRRIRKYGLDGPRPMEELEQLHDLENEILPALRKALAQAPSDLLAATIHLIRLLRIPELADDIATAALRHPAPLEARVEAVETLAEAGVEVPAAVAETMRVAREFAADPRPALLDRVMELPEAWRLAALEAWLQGEPVADPGLLERALGAVPALDPRVIARLGDSGQEAAAVVLGRLLQGDDRALRKEAKRALHRLRSLGVDAPEPAAEEGFSMALRPDLQREARAYATGIDGAGGRILWVLTPSQTGGERLLEAVIDDTHGLRRTDVMAVTRKGFRKHIQGLSENPAILVAEVEAGEAVAWLRQAERMTRSAAVELPDGYGRWLDEVGSQLAAGSGAEATAEASPSPADDDGELLRESVELLGDPAFANWAFTGPEAARGAAGVRAAETSTLVVDEEQRKQQVDRAIAAVAEAFDPALRERYRRRLVAMADMLARLRRDREAALAHAAAAGLLTVADLYSGHPFARAMLQRGVLAEYQKLREEERRESAGSRVVAP